MTQSQSEAAILKHVRQCLENLQTELVSLGVRVELIEPQRSEASESVQTEVAVYFWRAAQLLDALEFSVAEKGKPVASVAETNDWFDDALRDVIRRIKSSLPGT